MVYEIIRLWATIFFRMYFRRTVVSGQENIPPQGPLIVASNHPSAFLEAGLMGTILGRRLHYLVRGDMFHPRFSWLFDWTNQIPIYRQKDGISNLRKNASSFDLTYRKLSEGEAVLIFPEAKSILEKKMRPIQRGTAHLAFGALPYLKDNMELPVLPVAVNFTEPRLPGTDVVVRFGKPFMTQPATREDREAIDQFTSTLSDALQDLIIGIDDDGYELHYDVMASIYLRSYMGPRNFGFTHDDLNRISSWVNQHEKHKKHLELLHEYIHRLKGLKLTEGIYFPDLLVKNRLYLALLFMFKAVWLLVGGWIWRLTRQVIFSKIKNNTFKTPVSLGAAMVLFPVITILFLIVCLLAGWPLWFVAVWLFMMGMGVLIRPPVGLIWKVMTLKGKSKAELKKKVDIFHEEVITIVSFGNFK